MNENDFLHTLKTALQLAEEEELADYYFVMYVENCKRNEQFQAMMRYENRKN